MINKFETTTCLEEDKAMFQFQECQEPTNRPVKDHNFKQIEQINKMKQNLQYLQ